VCELDEKVDGAATSRVVLGNDVQILDHGISSCEAPVSRFTHHLNSLEHDHGPFATESKQAADAGLDRCDLAERVVERGQNRR
jgi:hypothetical protein